VQKSSTFFPQDFHRISTYKNTRKAFSDKGCLEFSTILAFPNFLNFYVDKYISLTFIYFCLDKGVHFTPPSIMSFVSGPTLLKLLTDSPLAMLSGGVAIGAGAIAWIAKKLIERTDLKRDPVAYIYEVRKLEKK
jgi:hypothetical protein